MTSTLTTPPVLELRHYTLHPGRRDELVALFEQEFIETQEAAGIVLVGLFRDARRPDRFVWIRGFSDMEARHTALEAFYGSPCWNAHRDAANATMIDSGNVLLLRPLERGSPMPVGTYRGPLLAATYLFASERDSATFAQRSAGGVQEALELDGATVLAALTTEASINTFQRLPVREGEHAVVLLLDGIEPERLVKHEPVPSDVAHLVPTGRSRIQLARAGSPGDFEFLNGHWNVTHHKLRSRLTGCDEWLQETGTCRGFTLAGGVVSVDEFDFPARNMKACSLRNLDREAARWTIHWTTSQSGRLFPPVHGGFGCDRGEFYGYDVEAGVPVLVRYIWSGCKSGNPRWEQAFSTDGGAGWETNWRMEFSKA